MTSRDGRLDFMPWWPMAMPSVTVMVQIRAACRRPSDALLDRLGWRIGEMLQEAASFQQVATPTTAGGSAASDPSHNNRSDAAHVPGLPSRAGWAAALMPVLASYATSPVVPISI